MEEEDRKDDGSVWTSYSDLFTTVAVIFLVMFVFALIRSGVTQLSVVMKEKINKQELEGHLSSKYKEKVKRQLSTIQKTVAEMDVTEKQIKENLRQVKVFTESLKKNKETIQDLAETQKRNQYIINNLKNKVEANKKTISEQRSSKKSLEKKIKKLKSENKGKSKTISNKETAIESLKQKIAQTGQKLEDKKRENQNLNKRISELDQSKRVVEKSLESQLVKSEQTEKKLTEQRNKLTSQNQKLTESLKNSQNKLKDLQRTLSSTNQKNSSLKKSLDQLTINLGHLEQKVKNRNQKIKSLKEKIAGYQNSEKELNSDIKGLKKQLAQMGSALKSSEQDAKNKGDRIENLNGQLKGLKGKISSLSGQLQEGRANINKLQGQNQGLNKELNHLKSQNKKLGENLNSTKKICDSNKQRYITCENDLVSLKNNQRQLKNKIEKNLRIAKDLKGGIRAKIAQKLKNEFTKAKLDVAIDPNTGTVTILIGEGILFKKNSYKLTNGAKNALKKLIPIYAKVLIGDPIIGNQIESLNVVGHASPTYKRKYVDPLSNNIEAFSYNLDLSMRRASEIMKYMFSKHTQKFKHKAELLRISRATGFGYLRPIKKMNTIDRSLASRKKDNCGPYHCKHSQRVEINFNLKEDNYTLDRLIELFKEIK